MTKIEKKLVFMAFFVFLLTGLGFNHTFGQSVTVSPTASGGTSCRTLPTLPGDKVDVNARYYVGPGGTPAPDIASIRVRANGSIVSGASFDMDFGAEGTPNQWLYRSRNNVAIETPSVDVCISATDYDGTDSASVTVSIAPRANLIAVAPTVSSNGDISYGYRLGSVLWNPRGNRVTTQLAFYNASTNQYTAINECTMEIATNISRSCPTVSASQVPTVPNGTTHLVTRVDRYGVVPESNENDNNTFSDLPKPNLRITNIAYDTENNINVSFRFDSLLPITPPNVQVKLNYAKGAQYSNVIGDYRSLIEGDLSLPSLQRNRDYNVQANRGIYPLPTWDATHLLASIDMPDNRLVESNETDNVKSAAISIAQNYVQRREGKGRGVSIYSNNAGYNITVVDLNKATMANSLENRPTTLGYFSKFSLRDHYKKAKRGSTNFRRVKVVLNGTLFGIESLSGTYVDNLVRPVQFPFGLKVNGRYPDLGYKSQTTPYGVPPLLFTFNRSSAAVVPYSVATLQSRRFSNLVGATVVGSVTPAGVKRTVFCLRDPIGVGEIGETRYKTVLFLSTSIPVTNQDVTQLLSRLGCQAQGQFDSGSASGLYADGRWIVNQPWEVAGLGVKHRPIPQAFTIYSGKQPVRPSSSAVGHSTSLLNEELDENTADQSFLAIRKHGTQSGTTEFSVFSGDGDYANIYNQLPTGIHATDDNYQFLLGDADRDGYNDLFVIKKLGVASTELHVLSGASGYKKYLIQTATGLHRTNAYWKYALTDWDNDNRPDLVAMSRSGGASGKVEAHILSAASNYQQFVLHAVTPLPYVDFNSDLQVGDWDGDSRPDLIAVKRDGVNSTELKILSGASNLTQYALQTATALHRTDSTWTFAVTDWDGGGRADLVGFKKQNTGTNSTEIHVLQGETQFQNFVLQIGTALPHTGGETELIIANNSGTIGDFDPAAKKYVYNEDGIYLFRNNEILEYTGQAPNGWSLIDNNVSSTDVVSTSTGLYQFHRQSGFVYWFNKTINNWQEIANNIAVTGIAATNDDLYVRNNAGAFYKYNGVPYSWTLLSQDSISVAIGATDDSLFQMHTTGRILRWNGSSWATVSTSYSTRQMVTTADDVFARRDTGDILAYNGSDWVTISNSDSTVSTIYADGETIYKQHQNGRVYRYIGTPLTGWSLVKW